METRIDAQSFKKEVKIDRVHNACLQEILIYWIFESLILVGRQIIRIEVGRIDSH